MSNILPITSPTITDFAARLDNETEAETDMEACGDAFQRCCVCHYVLFDHPPDDPCPECGAIAGSGRFDADLRSWLGRFRSGAGWVLLGTLAVPAFWSLIQHALHALTSAGGGRSGTPSVPPRLPAMILLAILLPVAIHQFVALTPRRRGRLRGVPGGPATATSTAATPRRPRKRFTFVRYGILSSLGALSCTVAAALMLESAPSLIFSTDVVGGFDTVDASAHLLGWSLLLLPLAIGLRQSLRPLPAAAPESLRRVAAWPPARVRRRERLGQGGKMSQAAGRDAGGPGARVRSGGVSGRHDTNLLLIGLWIFIIWQATVLAIGARDSHRGVEMIAPIDTPGAGGAGASGSGSAGAGTRGEPSFAFDSGSDALLRLPPTGLDRVLGLAAGWVLPLMLAVVAVSLLLRVAVISGAVRAYAGLPLPSRTQPLAAGLGMALVVLVVMKCLGPPAGWLDRPTMELLLPPVLTGVSTWLVLVWSRPLIGVGRLWGILARTPTAR